MRAEPLSISQMLERITDRFETACGAEPTEARDRAELALGRLFFDGYLEWWGMSELGEPVFVPSRPRQQGYISVVVTVSRPRG